MSPYVLPLSVPLSAVAHPYRGREALWRQATMVIEV